MHASGSLTAIGTKAKSDSSSADLFDLLARTEETARALSPRIPAPTNKPLPVTKAADPTVDPPTKPWRLRPVPTADPVMPTLVPKRAAAELNAQAVRARARYVFGFMLIELCGLQEDCNVCSKETSKLIMCNSSVPNLLYLPRKDYL